MTTQRTFYVFSHVDALNWEYKSVLVGKKGEGEELDLG